MKFFECCASIAHSWADVAAGIWNRYPNPYSKHVLTEDVLDRYLRNGKLHTVKLLTKTNPLPKWGERLYRGPKFITIIEESVVDPEKGCFVTYTRNITMTNFMSCTEKCSYKINDQDPQHTEITKQAWLDSQMGFGLKMPILEFSIKRYAKNQQKATLGLEHVIMNTQPRNIREFVSQSKVKLSEKAKYSKEVLSQKAKIASELAKSKADLSKITVRASEADH